MWSYVRAEVALVQVMVTGALCFVNLVYEQGLRGEAAMGAEPQKPIWKANKAIDGNHSQDFRSDSCAITNVDGNRNTSIWWKVFLQRPFNVAYLEIYFRSDTYTRSAGFSIYTFIPEEFDPLRDPKHLVYLQDPTSGCPTSVMNVTVNNVTQGIAFINTRPPGYTSSCRYDNMMYTGIEICEIRVMGCDADKFSSNCTHVCPSKCKNERCDAFNGSCIHGCSNPNALTIDCIECKDGFYNRSCTGVCGQCINGSPCQNETGYCTQCLNNFKYPLCKDCVSYKYGPNCAFDCGHCKNGRPCAVKNGVCAEGCESGWIGDLCVTAELNALEFNKNKNQLTTTGVAIIASLSTMFAISLIVNFFMGRQIMKNKTNRHQADASVPKNKKTPQMYVDISAMDENHAYSTLGSTASDTPYNVIRD